MRNVTFASRVVPNNVNHIQSPWRGQGNVKVIFKVKWRRNKNNQIVLDQSERSSFNQNQHIFKYFRLKIENDCFFNWQRIMIKIMFFFIYHVHFSFIVGTLIVTKNNFATIVTIGDAIATLTVTKSIYFAFLFYVTVFHITNQP